MTLSQLGDGEIAKIMAIEGGRGLRQKLHLWGLSEGKVIRVISGHGPMAIEVDRSIIALGRGMAHKIIVVRC